MELQPLSAAARSAGALVHQLEAAVTGTGGRDAAEQHGLTVWGDTVRAQSQVRCTVFRRGESMVFRAEAQIDGRVITNAVVSVHIANGCTLPMSYAPHAVRTGTPHYTSPPWTVALSQRTGPVVYTVTAVDPVTGASAGWAPFPGARSVLTIVPYPYSVTVTATPFGHAVRIAAVVTRQVTLPDGRPSAMPMRAGGASAAIGFDGNLSAAGILTPLRSTRLLYDESQGAWTGLIGTIGMTPGLYVVQVRAQDLVATPNAGTGTSFPFSLARAQ